MDHPPAKRFREEEPSRPTDEPSPVVHISGLTPVVTEADVLEALGIFGLINYASVKRYRGTYGLVEFESMSAAATCVTAGTTNAIFIGGAECRIGFSSLKSIMRIGFESARPNHVLVVSVSNLKYLINATTLKDICAVHGEVLRIAIIKRTHVLTSLVEFQSPEVAKVVKHAINGADIYSGCCTIKAEYANVDHVRIREMDSDHIDLTVPKDAPPSSTRKTLMQRPPSEEYCGGGAAPSLAASNNNYPAGYGRDGYPDSAVSRDGRSHSYESHPYARDPYGREMAKPEASAGYGGNGGYPPAYPGVGSKRPLREGAPPPPPPSAHGYLSREAYPPAGGPGGYPPTYPGGAPGQREYWSEPARRTAAPRRGDDYFGDVDPGAMAGGHGCVVLMYGVDQEKLNCDKVFNILCQYGNVLRVLFMKNKPDTIIFEMGTPSQARDVVSYLHGLEMFGLHLQFKISFQEAVKNVRDPFQLPDASPSFREYLLSRNQRFQNSMAATRNRLCHPQPVLHWFNAPPEMDGEKFTEMLQEKGGPAPINTYVFPSKTGRSASGTAEFATVVEATEALVLANHTPVSSTAGRHPFIVKVSFTTSRAPGPRFGGPHGDAGRGDGGNGN